MPHGSTSSKVGPQEIVRPWSENGTSIGLLLYQIKIVVGVLLILCITESVKRVEYPIIDKWYQEEAFGKTYHQDHGEEHDPHKVGSSRGCGGLGLWIDGQVIASNVFQDWFYWKGLVYSADSLFPDIGPDRQ